VRTSREGFRRRGGGAGGGWEKRILKVCRGLEGGMAKRTLSSGLCNGCRRVEEGDAGKRLEGVGGA